MILWITGSRIIYNSNIFTLTDILDNDNVSVMEGKYGALSLIFYKDGKVLEYYMESNTSYFGLGVGNIGRWIDIEQRAFLLGRDKNCTLEYYVTNILTGKENKLDINVTYEDLYGSTDQVVNRNGVLVKNDTNYELYKFN